MSREIVGDVLSRDQRGEGGGGGGGRTERKRKRSGALVFFFVFSLDEEKVKFFRKAGPETLFCTLFLLHSLSLSLTLSLLAMLKKSALPAPPPQEQAKKKRDFLDESDDDDAQPIAALEQPKLRVNEGFAKRLEVRRRRKKH